MTIEPLTAALMAYAISTTGLPYPDAGPPEVRFETHEQIQLAVYGDVDSERSSQAEAYYDSDSDAVVLHESWTPTTPVAISELLHEIVHYLQDQQDPARWPRVIAENDHCTRAELEKPAYDTQIEFLRAAGVEDPYEAMQVSKLFVHFLTICMPQHM